MAKTCVNHGEVAAATMCHQCHVPVCSSCTIVTPHGSFCSSDCSLRHREFGEKLRSGELRQARGGVSLKLFLGLLVLVGGLSVIHFAAIRGVGPARRLDLIGLFLDRLGGLAHGALQ